MEEIDHHDWIVSLITFASTIAGLILLALTVSDVLPTAFQVLHRDVLLLAGFFMVGLPIVFLTWIAITDLRMESVRMHNYDLVLSAALEHSDIAIMVTNAGERGPSIKICYVNPAWEKLFGWSAEEVIDRENPHLLNSGKQPETYYHGMWDALKKNEPFISHVVDRCKDGRLLEIDSTIVPVLFEGHATYYVGILRDVTERLREQANIKKQKEELARMNRFMVDRELRMKELKEELAELKSRI